MYDAADVYDAIMVLSVSFKYDPFGRRIYKSSSSGTGIYAYDNNGNTLTKVVGSNTTSYAWDFENRMSSVTLPGSGGTVSFKYDPFGRRIYKSSSSATSIYAYDGDNLIEETNAAGAVVARYSQTQNIDEPLAMLRSGTTSYYHADGLGSTTSLSSLSSSTGSLAQTYGYDSFGKQTSSSGSLTNPFQFTARESDTETALYFLRARYFDAATGRFLSEDLVRFNGGLSFYAYVSNSPLNFVDPFGLDKCKPNDCKNYNPYPGYRGPYRGQFGPGYTPWKVPYGPSDLDVFNKALGDAKKATCDPNCDGALQDFGIKSLAAFVNQMAANVNVFDGRKSTYPRGKQTVSQFLAQGTAGAVAFTDVELTYLANYFWNPTSIDNMPQQRALILLHESVHEFGHRPDQDFGQTNGSKNLSDKIAEKCFPALKALKKLGNLTN